MVRGLHLTTSTTNLVFFVFLALGKNFDNSFQLSLLFIYLFVDLFYCIFFFFLLWEAWLPKVQKLASAALNYPVILRISGISMNYAYA